MTHLTSAIAAFAGALAVTAGCSSSSTPLVVFPTTAQIIPAGFKLPSAVPGDCSGQVYFAIASTLCPGAASTFFLCDGETYTDYDCTSPGPGWMVETQVPDPMASVASSAAGSGGASSSGSSTGSK
jgi:hypothetical protein